MFKFILLCFLAIAANASLILGKFECQNCENLNPQNIKKVYASNPTLLYSLYSFDKSLIAGLVFEFWDIEKRYLDKNVYSLPVVGGFYGQGRVPNIEMVLSLKPDLIITSINTKDDPKYGGIFRSLKVPVLYIDDEDSFGVQIYKAFGEIFGNQKKADELIAYAEQSQKMAESLAKLGLNKPSVYYAFGSDGLETECGSSSFIKLVDLAGGDTAKFKCKSKNKMSRVKADFEKILAANPEVILVYEKEFFDKIWSDKKWNLINAVKNKRVYLIPRSPFSWVGKPASFTKLLGLRWLIDVLHKDALNIDIRREASEFYRLFLYVDLSKDDLDFILNEKN
ncbi:ABC transporter substrate-binding protein [Campylobacter fetus]|uniref:ABC transporter substrate-binding protein n=1 Tax=Campylobacter fetus TaxID=196 RepID=UPI000A8B2865|nr:ABC transporter substrate-binding protein [Campylobacter fetus]